MTWKNIVAAATLAGSIIAGGAAGPAPSYGISGRNFEPAYRALAVQENSSYRSYIQNYVSGLQRNYGDLLPKNLFLKSAFNSESSDHQLFADAMELYGAAMQNYMRRQRHEPKEENKNFHLVPYQSSDGSVYFTDLNGHGQLKLIKNSSGLYSMIGASTLFEAVGGRGMGDTFIKNLMDEQFFKDGPRR